uniref:Uncharacterized protein n=1 Tax=Leersia perrieri TaxID=77586 RepID=A0A0D9WF30_9ORYZ
MVMHALPACRLWLALRLSTSSLQVVGQLLPLQNSAAISKAARGVQRLRWMSPLRGLLLHPPHTVTRRTPRVADPVSLLLSPPSLLPLHALQVWDIPEMVLGLSKALTRGGARGPAGQPVYELVARQAGLAARHVELGSAGGRLGGDEPASQADGTA